MSDPASPTLTPDQWQKFSSLLDELTPNQRVWISGYAAGYSAISLSPATTPPHNKSSSPITVLFGSQTGNSEKIAKKLFERIEQTGRPVKIDSMASYKTSQLKRESDLLIIVSTHGEGEPPDNALGFHQFLHSNKAPKVDHLRYAVLALGDSSYEHFCQTGREIEDRLNQLGGEALINIVECDVDYDEKADSWIADILTHLGSTSKPSQSFYTATERAQTSTYTKAKPYQARLLENLPLTAPASSKDIRHIVLSIEDSGIRYQPGDALGVLPTNWPARVEELITHLNLYHADTVASPTLGSTTLEKALLHDLEITTLTRPFLESYAKLADSKELNRLLHPDHRSELRAWIYGREVIDVLKRFPVRGIHTETFIGLLRKLPPRLYSIASSWNADPDEVHLTVGVVRYKSHGIERHGVASTYLADRLPENDTAPIYVHENPNFKLPGDSKTPIIMIGPGTGVAPFRAFISDREATGATGRNWLFFGDRNFDTDFIYQTEWLDYRRKGLLHRIDVAFSRDTDTKVYVQDRIRQNSKDIYGWIQEGAHIYVCGDGQHMAPDVHSALLDILVKEGQKTHDEAGEFLRELQAAKRYQRDVY